MEAEQGVRGYNENTNAGITDVDILVAGFACVDFSRLSPYPRRSEEVGESSHTAHAIITIAHYTVPRLSFSRTYRAPLKVSLVAPTRI